MSLSVALNSARSSLLATAKQIAVSGRNITGANDPNYTRKIALPTVAADGSVTVSVSRATDLALFYRMLGSNSAATGQQALLDGLNRLQDSVGDSADGTSPASLIGALSDALQAEANAPTDRNLAQATVTAAQAVVSSLNSASRTVQAVRNDADAAMATSVGKINDLLGQFQKLNDSIVHGTTAGEDVSAALDQRDAILGQLTDEMGVTVVARANNDVAIYTDSGVPLFDKIARTVTFQPNSPLTAGADGNAVLVDGVPVTGANATMPLRAGKLAGLAALRDQIAPTFQAQLDETARGLIASFAESDQSGGGGADRTGLFAYSGAPAVPASGTAGLAVSISVNPAVDPSQGGSLDRLRDGGINGVNYQYNATGATSFADRLTEIAAALGATRSFDSSSGLQANATLADFSTASVSWLEDQRKSTSTAVDYHSALLTRASEALSNATGVNMDDEYAHQLQLEQSYQASAKLINVVNQLYQALFDAVK